MGKHKTTAGSFTPGPWEQIKIKNPHVPGATCIYEKLPRHNAGGVFQHKIAEVIPWDNDHANARLIAAAPELLEALGGCADALNECAKQFRLEKLFGHAQLAENHLRDAHAAIAKATNARR